MVPLIKKKSIKFNGELPHVTGLQPNLTSIDHLRFDRVWKATEPAEYILFFLQKAKDDRESVASVANPTVKGKRSFLSNLALIIGEQ